MRQSELFTKTRKEAPKDEVSRNAQLLIRAGFVDKLMAGVYTYLPLGLRVLNKINNIIREEMNAIGGQELLMPALHPKKLWEQTGRWSEVDILYKLKSKNGGELTLGPTHEEVITPIAKDFISSYKDLPRFVYQIQDKFRNESRAKSGILRGREFLMKDLYSFHADEKDLESFYKIAEKAYIKIFKRVGIGKQTYLTFASGGIFSQFSHEFQTLTPAGEDTIHICDKCSLAINKEIIAKQPHCTKCKNKNLREEKSIEVGNIFNLGTRFSDAFDLKYLNKKGEKKPVWMGSYGIGLGRIMGTIVEVFNDKSGIIWPESVAPFDVHLIALPGGEKEADKLYKDLQNQKIEVLYDEREDKSAGEKFADADLIGIPWRAVVSEKTAGKIELKRRDEDKAKLISIDKLVSIFNS